jgi:hypothetical protein
VAAKPRSTKRPVARRKAPAPAHAVRKALARPAARGKSAKDARFAGVGSAVVLRATGRAWDEWLAVLDRAGAKAMPHKDIALLLSRKFAVPDWWSQMVTVGYEQARGLRLPHQRADGFAANSSRTVGTGLGCLYEAWSDPLQRARWLPDAPLEVRVARSRKSIRMTWLPGGSSVEVGFLAKAPGKSQVAVQHGKLASAAAAKRQKAYWAAALERLKALLEAAG